MCCAVRKGPSLGWQPQFMEHLCGLALGQSCSAHYLMRLEPHVTGTIITLYSDGESEIQRGDITCPRSPTGLEFAL